ncbi:unnamed protein product [Soboliphyme baturini]|uniref:Lipase maturation factor n=1 Tax=Soboliphyme baturini TaxID=241478 RepID=A0A183IZH2_9BILA|nr:unnamed protein product [Soboliphyme baturini]
MFASGVVKLTSGCPTWWQLTALHYHFESQCIPTPLAWFAHQIPGWFKQLSVLATYMILLLLSPFMLLPVKHLRWLAFLGQVISFEKFVLRKSGPWKEYEFLYKVGSVARRPPVNIPHQPRIDWQLWFAALDSSYLNDPWFINLVYRLFTNSTEVLHLIDRNPFLKTAPKFLRSNRYLYHYTTFSDLKYQNCWWWREFDGVFMPVLAHDNPHLKQYLVESGMVLEVTRRLIF